MDNFKAEKISQTASFIVDRKIDEVFPLFGAFEERKWEKSWDPVLIYPEEEIIQEGTTFTSAGNTEEGRFLWIISKFEPDEHLIQYLVSTKNRFWTITVACRSISNNQTEATVTYSFTGLNEPGNELNKKALERMYSRNLRDWKEAIDSYFDHFSGTIR